MGKRRHRNHCESISSDRKKLLSVILIWSAVAIISLFIALFIGNALKKESDKLKSTEVVSAFSYTYESDSVAPIKANFINLSGHTDESLKSAIDSLPSHITAVSLYLKKQNTPPVYRSEVSKAVLNSTGNIDLAAAVAQLHSKNIYVSACFDCNSFEAEDKNAKNASIIFEASMIAEAFISGVDDIIILNMPVKNDGIASAAMLFSEVRKIVPDACLGAAIDYEALISESGASALKDYSEFASFCAIDTANSQATNTSLEAITESILYVFELYPLRMLIGVSGDDDFNNKVDILNSFGITNIQAYKNIEPTAFG